MFCRHGIPKTVISDNGPQFKSVEYKMFAKEYGFTPVYTNPLYPQSNGRTEMFVQTITKLVKKAMIAKSDINIALLNYRNTPLRQIGKSPAQLLMNR